MVVAAAAAAGVCVFGRPRAGWVCVCVWAARERAGEGGGRGRLPVQRDVDVQPPLDRVVSAHEVAVRREEARLAAWPEVEEDDRLRERLAPEGEVADVARDRGAQPKGDPARLA